MIERRSARPPVQCPALTQDFRSGEDSRDVRYSRRVRGDLPQAAKSRTLLEAHLSPIAASHNELWDFDSSSLSNNDAFADPIHAFVEISPPESVRRHAVVGDRIAVESVQSIIRSKVQYRFCAPSHLLVMYEKGERHDGETFVEGLPRSKLRNLERRLTFVPAGHEYHEWHEPRGRTRLMHFYFAPEKLNIFSELGRADMSIAPRLLFEDAALWQTALKLKLLVESPGSGDQLYFESLSTLLINELVRLDCGLPSIKPRVRGGLAPWQERIVTAYIEEHLHEPIPMTTLAELVRLSRHHFCRVFKHSLGVPPHRYQTNRRMECAKLLLADRAPLVTEIGLTLGFSSSNAFATAFRKATGFTPTDYRRLLAPG
jgi:AraC family transcriptional regulator